MNNLNTIHSFVNSGFMRAHSRHAKWCSQSISWISKLHCRGADGFDIYHSIYCPYAYTILTTLCTGLHWIPVCAIPLIHRSCSNRALLWGSHIACWTRHVVIWYNRRTYWLQRTIGRVTPTQGQAYFTSKLR